MKPAPAERRQLVPLGDPEDPQVRRQPFLGEMTIETHAIGVGEIGIGDVRPLGRPAPVSCATAGPTHATRGQRLALIAGVLVVGWLALELFASVLAPFVAAAVLAYALDPPTTRLTRLGLRRGAAASVMVLALVAGLLLFALLLYPLLLLQIKLLATRIPQ